MILLKNRYEFHYEVLENFQGSKDNFWRCEKYLAIDFERNGFSVEELISDGKIKVGIKRSETVYYMALDVFQGSDDVFWSSEIYDIEDIESNGFTVDSLMEEGKIKLWQKEDDK